MPQVLVSKKLRPSLGEARPRTIRSGTGRGGDTTGSWVSVLEKFQRALAVDTAGRESPRETHALGSLCDCRFTKR